MECHPLSRVCNLALAHCTPKGRTSILQPQFPRSIHPTAILAHLRLNLRIRLVHWRHRLLPRLAARHLGPPARQIGARSDHLPFPNPEQHVHRWHEINVCQRVHVASHKLVLRKHPVNDVQVRIQLGRTARNHHLVGGVARDAFGLSVKRVKREIGNAGIGLTVAAYGAMSLW